MFIFIQGASVSQGKDSLHLGNALDLLARCNKLSGSIPAVAWAEPSKDLAGQHLTCKLLANTMKLVHHNPAIWHRASLVPIDSNQAVSAKTPAEVCAWGELTACSYNLAESEQCSGVHS